MSAMSVLAAAGAGPKLGPDYGNSARLREQGIRILILEGGEPFLWKDGNYAINDLVREARKHFFVSE